MSTKVRTTPVDFCHRRTVWTQPNLVPAIVGAADFMLVGVEVGEHLLRVSDQNCHIPGVCAKSAIGRPSSLGVNR